MTALLYGLDQVWLRRDRGHPARWGGWHRRMGGQVALLVQGAPWGRPDSGRIKGTQYRRAAGTGDSRQVAGLTVNKALRQPGKRRALHPVGGDPQLYRVGDAPAGQQADQFRQQRALWAPPPQTYSSGRLCASASTGSWRAMLWQVSACRVRCTSAGAWEWPASSPSSQSRVNISRPVLLGWGR